MATTPKPITGMLEKTTLVDADLIEIVDSVEPNLSLKNKKVTVATLKTDLGGVPEIDRIVYSGGGVPVIDGGTEQTLLDDILIDIDAAKLIQFDIQVTVTGTNSGRYDVQLYSSSTIGGPYSSWGVVRLSFNGYGTLYDSGNISAIRGNSSSKYWRMTIQRIGGTANNIPAGSNFVATVYNL